MPQMVKSSPAVWETWVRSLGWEDPLEESNGNPLQYSTFETPHGQRSLVCYSHGITELDTTEWLSTAQTSVTFHFNLKIEQNIILFCDSIHMIKKVKFRIIVQ